MLLIAKVLQNGGLHIKTCNISNMCHTKMFLSEMSNFLEQLFVFFIKKQSTTLGTYFPNLDKFHKIQKKM